MHISKDATDGNKSDESQHYKVKKNTNIDVVDVFFEINRDEQENGGYDHDVG